MFEKINLFAFSGNNAIEEVKIVDRFSESINRLATRIDSNRIDY